MPFPHDLSFKLINAMTPDMARRLAGLHLRCFTGPESWSVEEFQAIPEDPVRWGVYAETEAEGPVGLAVVMEAGDNCELLTIGCHPSFRNMGIARYMLQFLEDVATSRRSARLLLDVAADNPEAISLYTSEGYSQQGVRKGYYDRGAGMRTDAILMVKPIGKVG